MIYVGDIYILTTLFPYKTPTIDMKLLKKILLVFVGLIVIAILALWLVTRNVTHTAVRNLLNQKLVAMTSQKSRINGKVTWHLFPRPGIKITQILVATNGEQANSSLFVENLLFNLQFTPLLHGKLVFRELKIDGVTANIQNPDPQLSVGLGRISEANGLTTNNSSIQFAIDRFLLTRGQITITQAKHKLTLSNLYLSAEQLNLKKNFFPLELKTNLALATPQNKIKAKLRYEGKLRLAPSIFTEPLVASQNIAINGQLLAQNLRFNQFKISRLTTTAKTKKGTLALNPLNMSLFAGKSVGNLTYQFATKKLFINQTAANLDANSFFKTIFYNNLVKGNLDISAHGSVNLQDEQWQNNLSGNGQLTIKNGVLYFTDLQALADNASKKIHFLSAVKTQNDMDTALEQSLAVSKTRSSGSTPFQLLSLPFQLANGKFISDALLLQTEPVHLKGNGQINLNNSALNGNLFATLITTDTIVNKIQQLLGGSFPLNLTGTLSEPKIAPNEREINPIVTRYILTNVLVYPVKQIKSLPNALLSPALLLLN